MFQNVAIFMFAENVTNSFARFRVSFLCVKKALFCSVLHSCGSPDKTMRQYKINFKTK